MCAASCHSVDLQPAPASADKDPEHAAPIILIGNPNVGKSVIFGRLTGRYVVVSNYPGTTVEVARGTLPDGTPILDTPGTNTISGQSDDERVARDVLLDHRDTARAVIQVADAKNLRRALLLTLQLADLGVRMVLVLNMLDEAEAHGLQIDASLLSKRLGIDVVTMVATRGEGMDELLAAIDRARPIATHPSFDSHVEAALARIEGMLPSDVADRRGAAVRLLGGDPALAARFHLNGALSEVQESTAAHFGRPARTVLIGQQMAAASALLEGVVTEPEGSAHGSNSSLSHWLTHPLLGWPILFAVLFLVYKFVGEFGAGTLVDFMESRLFGEVVNPLAARLIDTVLPVPFIHDLLVGEYGVISMALTYGLALVLPIVATFFIAFSILEDTGYLPRLAVMLNRAFKLMGLNGKAVLPMVLGLGCDTMATMTTRILETRKERILTTLLLALGVPCSAQLGVIVGTMLIVGLIAARLVPGERGDFVLELPPIRLPHPGNVLIKTLARLEWYLKEVLPLFVVGTLILFALDRTGALALVEKAASPLVAGFLGLPEAAAGAFLIGFLRRDYGAAGLFAMALAGQLNAQQVVVSLVVITLFIPCIANVLMIVKEYGSKVALRVALTVFPLAFLVGGIVNAALNFLKIAV